VKANFRVGNGFCGFPIELGIEKVEYYGVMALKTIFRPEEKSEFHKTE
jgi:hypothetical protein